MSLGVIGLLVLVFVVSVVLNALFACYETGFVSSNPTRIRNLAEKDENRYARQLLEYLEHPDSIITILLVGCNISLIVGAVAMTQLVGNVWAPIIATPVFLLLGELFPKSAGRLHPTRVAIWLLPVVRFFAVLLTPITWPALALSRGVLLLVHGKTQQSFEFMMRSADDMRDLVNESADHGAIEEEEKAMIHSIMDLQNRYPKEVMTPRVDIQALPDTATRTELVEVLKESNYTRIPIFQDSKDKIIGTINAYDVLCEEQPDNEDITRFVRPPLHVPDTMPLDDVMRAMRAHKESMAIVVDEYGCTDGLLTMEDILEEIFGEIQDEYDTEAAPIRRVGGNAFLIEARTSLKDAGEALGVELDDTAAETVGGWLMHLTRRIPQKGEVLCHAGFRITILDGSARAVARIRIEQAAPGETSPTKGAHE